MRPQILRTRYAALFVVAMFVSAAMQLGPSASGESIGESQASEAVQIPVVFYVVDGCARKNVAVTYASGDGEMSQSSITSPWYAQALGSHIFTVSAQKTTPGNCDLTASIISGRMTPAEELAIPANNWMQYLLARGEIVKSADTDIPFGVASATWANFGDGSGAR